MGETHGAIAAASKMEGYSIYQGPAETKPTDEEEQTERKTTPQQSKSTSEMQNSKGDGGMAFAIKENIQQYVKKAAQFDARIAIVHIKRKYKENNDNIKHTCPRF